MDSYGEAIVPNYSFSTHASTSLASRSSMAAATVAAEMERVQDNYYAGLSLPNLNSAVVPHYPFMTTSSLKTDDDRSIKEKQSQLYKTEYCRNWSELGTCRYGKKCRYAHGDDELRRIPRHSRYKTRICRAYHIEGTCLYGSRCTFIHDDEVEGGATVTKQRSSITNGPDTKETKYCTRRHHTRKDTSTATSIAASTATATATAAAIPDSTLLMTTCLQQNDLVNDRSDSLSTIIDHKHKNTGSQQKKIWNSKLGLNIQQPLDHPFSIYRQESSNNSVTPSTHFTNITSNAISMINEMPQKNQDVDTATGHTSSLPFNHYYASAFATDQRISPTASSFSSVSTLSVGMLDNNLPTTPLDRQHQQSFFL